MSTEVARNGLEVLARQRRRYERLVYSRLRDSITWEDAEDIVSDALIRAERAAAEHRPADSNLEAWFARIALNQGIDFVRARDGRRRKASSTRPTSVSITALAEAGIDLPESIGASTGAPLAEPGAALEDEVERELVASVVNRVLSELTPKEVELIKLRHLFGADRTREELAAMAGLSLGKFRGQYAKAWAKFERAIAAQAPTPRCRPIRRLIAAIAMGTAPAKAAAEVDAHVLDCPACRVFARHGYRALEALPVVPTVGLVERIGSRFQWWWERTNPELAAGTGVAATGAGLLAWLSGGAGVAKVVAIFCSVTAVTAGVCGGIAVLLGDPEEPPPGEARKPAEKPRPRTTPRTVRAATPAPTAVATRTPAPKPRRVRTPEPTPPPRPRPAATQPPAPTGETAIPAVAPQGAQEFEPSVSEPAQPAPAPASGGGEFSP